MRDPCCFLGDVKPFTVYQTQCSVIDLSIGKVLGGADLVRLEVEEHAKIHFFLVELVLLLRPQTTVLYSESLEILANVLSLNDFGTLMFMEVTRPVGLVQSKKLVRFLAFAVGFVSLSVILSALVCCSSQVCSQRWP